MPTSFLSVASATPKRCISQLQWLDFFEHYSSSILNKKSRAFLSKILAKDHGIKQRHTAIDPELFLNWNAETANKQYELHAPKLAAQAVTKALAKAQQNASSLDAIFLCSCTGYLCPGASTHVAEHLQLHPHVHLADLTGFGCAAAIPTLHQAAAYLALHPEALVAVVAVELSSATFFLDNSPSQLISLCLFGDGAASLILCGKNHPAAKYSQAQFSHFQSLLQPQDREHIRLAPAPQGLIKNQLSKSVPELAANAVLQLWQQDTPPPSSHILSHGGGKTVLEKLRQHFPQQSFLEAEQVLKNYGNLSSPSVFFALDYAWKQREHPHNTASKNSSLLPQSYWLTGFGAGFSAHSCRLTPNKSNESNQKSQKSTKKPY